MVLRREGNKKKRAVKKADSSAWRGRAGQEKDQFE